MRIFQILEASANEAVPSNRTWIRNLYEPLLDMGHDVYLFSAEEGRRAMRRGSPSLAARFTQRILQTFQREHAKCPFDLVFAYLMDGMVEQQGIAELKRYGVPVCNFSCNNAHQFDLVARFAAMYDFNLHSEKDAGTKFRSIGANAVWWPMASNPKYFRPMEIDRDVAASFVGGNYGVRARIALQLLESGVDFHAYGPGWRWGASTPTRAHAKRWLYLTRAALSASSAAQSRWSSALAEQDIRRHVGRLYAPHLHDPVSDEELIALYSRSHVSIGILDVYDGHDASKRIVRHMHLREFEAPMCGALYLTGLSAELAELFEPDQEVLVYRDLEELIDKAQFYTIHPGAGEKIRRAGLRRALADHTWQKRYEKLFGIIGVPKARIHAAC
jgi:spore maturation protein CgeB